MIINKYEEYNQTEFLIELTGRDIEELMKGASAYEEVPMGGEYDIGNKFDMGFEVVAEIDKLPLNEIFRRTETNENNRFDDIYKAMYAALRAFKVAERQVERKGPLTHQKFKEIKEDEEFTKAYNTWTYYDKIRRNYE